MGLPTMSQIKIELTVRGNYNSKSENVSVSGSDRRHIEIMKEVEDVETFVELLEVSQNEAIRYVWNDIKDEEEWEEWGQYGPYMSGNITLTASRTGVSWMDIATHIAERDDATIPGVLLLLRMHGRTPKSDSMDIIFKQFVSYLAGEEGIDTSYWTHGREAGDGSGLF